MPDYLTADQTKQLLAIALKYNKAMKAPQMVAKGYAEVAQQIIDEAKKANIPIKQDKDVAALLSYVQVNDYIPYKAFVTVAKILACIYKAEKN